MDTTRTAGSDPVTIEIEARPTMAGHADDIDDIQAGLLRTLASPHRLRIIHRLGIGQCGVTELARDLGLSQAAASQHLAVMRGAGIVDAVREGRVVRYELSDREILAACSAMRSVLVRRLSRLGDLAAAASAPGAQTVNANEGGSR
jgi:DNA-binding transcriptional ArsR family regulator